MIVKNEEEVLARCLDSIKDAVDEIIIVDTGSTDRTKAIARKYTEKIYDFEWINDFSAARNEAFSKATKAYQLWLDADDIVPPASVKQLQALKMILNPSVDVVTMKYVTHFDDNGNPILKFARERLLKRENNFKWVDPVHEYIPMAGNIQNTEIEIHHKKIKQDEPSYRNLNIYNELIKKGMPLTPRQQYYFGRELKDHGQWIKAAYYFEKFLDGEKGWVEDNISTCLSLAICYNIMGDKDKVLPILMRSFSYDTPRAEICSEIGYYYKHQQNYAQALKWFQLATGLERPDTNGFILLDYWGYIPNIECCVCCCHLKAFALAKEYNERAAAFKPDSVAVKTNREYLKSLETIVA